MGVFCLDVCYVRHQENCVSLICEIKRKFGGIFGVYLGGEKIFFYWNVKIFSVFMICMKAGKIRLESPRKKKRKQKKRK